LLAACGCRDDRVEKLEAGLVELRTEADRLRRDLEDLRRRGGGAVAPSAGGADDATRRRLEELEAFDHALLESLDAAASGPRASELHGVWRTSTAERERRGAQAPGVGAPVEQTLQYLSDGRVCGWLGRTGGSREPFAGRWRLSGRHLVEIRDEWTGARNEPRGLVREVAAVGPGTLELRGVQGDRFERVNAGALAALRSLREDRVAPIGGLQDWCLRDAAR